MSFTVDVDASQAEKYKTLFKVAGDKLLPEIDKAVQITVNEGKKYITEKTPKITGNLRRGFQVQRLGPAVWMIYYLIKYATWIEIGQRKLKEGSDKTVFMAKRIGGYRMIKNSIKEIQERLALNIKVALTKLMYWRA